MQNSTISGFPDPRHPAGSQGVKFRKPFMRPFAPVFGWRSLARIYTFWAMQEPIQKRPSEIET